MGTVGSTSRVDGVDLQLMVNAANTPVRPQTGAPAGTADAESDARISAAGRLRSATSAVLDAAARLTKTQTWQATKASSSDESIVQAVSDKTAPGDYMVTVESMAAAQTTSSATFSSLSTVIGIGTLNIELGSWNTSQSTFATNPNWPKASVTFGPKDNSLERIRDKINAAGVGVVALVVSDATGSRLVLRSTATGNANGFKASAAPAAQASGEAAQALASLGYDANAISGGAALTQAAQDAKVSVDGRALQSGQNLLEDQATGLTLRLHGAQQEPVKVSVTADTPSMAHEIHAFAHAYNDMVGQLAHGDAISPEASADAARSIEQRMQAAFKQDTGAGSLQGPLRQIGIELRQDGQLDIDHRRLTQALSEDPQQVQRLFDGQGPGGEAAGLAARLMDLRHGDPGQGASPVDDALRAPDAATGTSVGTLFRQRLLEQYAATSQHEDEAAMSANEA